MSDDLGNAIHHTRMIRFGLEAIWAAVDDLPDRMAAPDDVRTALGTITQWLSHTEEAELRNTLATRRYAIIRPVDLVSPPDPSTMTTITQAIAVLNTNGLVVHDHS